MKKIFSIIAILALIISFSSCGNKKQKDTVNTHTHEDGPVHANDAHSNDNDVKPAQESFEVKEEKDVEHNHKQVDANVENQVQHEHGGSEVHEHNHGESK